VTNTPPETHTPFEARRGDYVVSTDQARLDLDVIYGYLSRSYWAAGRPREIVARSLHGSLCFGLYHGERQVGLARVISDRATFAWLCDVFVLEEHRGEGLGVWLIETVLSHPELQGLRRFLLATRDAHELYTRFGFAPLAAPERWMERLPDAATHPASTPSSTPEGA
jgi:GNAT superfamily N-acetyltransferase